MVFSRVFIMIQNLITVVMLTLSLVVALQINGLVKAPHSQLLSNFLVCRR